MPSAACKRGGRPGRKRLTDAQMLTLIQAIQVQFKRAYGSPRPGQRIAGKGLPSGHKGGCNGCCKRMASRRHPNAVSRSLPTPGITCRSYRICWGATSPQQHRTGVWTSAITTLWTDAGWGYLASVLDLCKREVVGWSCKPRMPADSVTEALMMAWFRRKLAGGLLHHSGRPSQYAGLAFQALAR